MRARNPISGRLCSFGDDCESGMVSGMLMAPGFGRETVERRRGFSPPLSASTLKVGDGDLERASEQEREEVRPPCVVGGDRGRRCCCCRALYSRCVN